MSRFTAYCEDSWKKRIPVTNVNGKFCNLEEESANLVVQKFMLFLFLFMFLFYVLVLLNDHFLIYLTRSTPGAKYVFSIF